MTTYGTIPATPLGSSNLEFFPATPPASSNLEFFSRAKERIRSNINKRKPWKEMIDLQSMTLPITTSTATTTTTESMFQRLKTNLAYFHVNYAMIVLFILFLTLLYHPISLIFFIITMSAWLFFYFLRDEPLVVLGLQITDRGVLIGLSVLTIGLLFLTGATVNIVVGVVLGVVVVVVHGVLRRTDNFFVDGGDDEVGFGSVAAMRHGGGARMALKETASSSYSLS
ncbi:hypothetical protein L1049_023270 [Liquidambar formosana]|uniref:PRA1 family protein n=1 Tax=Liquidambar formosana TaxID=63359 RepID=A0AAP0WQ34_LIQFO